MVSEFVNDIIILGGMITQFPTVTEHAEFEIYMIEGIVIWTVPVGDCAGNMYGIERDIMSLFL